MGIARRTACRHGSAIRISGASNPLAISNLEDGQHTLTLTVLAAPDNIGTCTVQLDDGLEFTNASTSKRGSAPQGATMSWGFVVP